MKYVANPVVVDAWVITCVTERPKPTISELEAILNETPEAKDIPEAGSLIIELEGKKGADVIATRAMISRMTPQVGDYWVQQSDGYVYLNPKDVFERKYRPAPELDVASAVSA